MPASSTAYGSTNPGAIDPFPIESVLAKIVGENNPANAQNMLNTYQIQNQTSQGNYNYNLQQQHDFAKEQLRQQMIDNYMKYGQEAVKTPGGLSLLSAQTGGAALGGFDPSAIETSLAAARNATTLQHAGAGAYSAAQAGRDITDEQAAAASGGLLGPQGTPLSTRNLLIKEAGANARHAAGAGGGPSFSMQLPTNPELPGVVTSMSVKKGQDPRAALTAAEKLGVYKPAIPVKLPESDGGGDSEAPPTTLPVAQKPAPAPKGATSLPPKTAPQAQQRVQQQAQGGGQAQRAANAFAENTVRLRSPEAYADMMAGATNGNVLLITGPDGTLHIKGKSGRLY
jgi:hypothetical protein